MLIRPQPPAIGTNISGASPTNVAWTFGSMLTSVSQKTPVPGGDLRQFVAS